MSEYIRLDKAVSRPRMDPHIWGWLVGARLWNCRLNKRPVRIKGVSAEFQRSEIVRARNGVAVAAEKLFKQPPQPR